MSTGDNFVVARNGSCHGSMGVSRGWRSGSGEGGKGRGSLAEHDYMSDVTSAPAGGVGVGVGGVGAGDDKCCERMKAEDGGDADSSLNLRETELRLGPPESRCGAKRGFSEAMGGLSEASGATGGGGEVVNAVQAGKEKGEGEVEGEGIVAHVSAFRVPQLPPPWQALEQPGAPSFGPFPCHKELVDCRDLSLAWERRVAGGMEAAAFPLAADSRVTNGNANAPSPNPDASPSQASRGGVVGWPPVRPMRKSSGTPPLKPSPAAAEAGVVSKAGKLLRHPPNHKATALALALPGSSSPAAVTSNYCFVKVYMDGVPFGRKVDLRLHGCYEKLSVGLEEMFTRYATKDRGPASAPKSDISNKSFKFLQGSDYVLTYEDQDGDLMLVGDVPWNMFVTSVKRLRIMKSSEAIGIAPRNGHGGGHPELAV